MMNFLPPPIEETALLFIEIICFLSGAVLGAIWGLLRAEKLHRENGGSQ